MLVCMDSGKQYEVDLLSAIHMLKHSWTQVKEATIANCFCHAGFVVNSAAVAVDAERTADGESEDSSLVAALLACGVGLNTYHDNVSTCRKDTVLSLIEEVQDKMRMKVRCLQMLKRNLW